MIPNTAHFIWLGASMPWIYSLALRSALRKGDFERVLIHHSHDLSSLDWWPELAAEPGFFARRLDPASLLEQCGERGAALVDLYRGLRDARAQANVLRIALLCVEGGVYLDADTLTVGSLRAVRAGGGAFCGAERLVFPASLSFQEPLGVALALAKNLARDAMRRVPDGWRWFRRYEHWYPVAANNAVFGAERGHDFVCELLDRMLAVPLERRAIRYELGTSLLQHAVLADRSQRLTVHPPPVFYPLGPEISEHWFKRGDPSALGEVLAPETCVVHWYASVRTQRVVKRANPAWVRAHAKNQLFSALAAEVLA